MNKWAVAAILVVCKSVMLLEGAAPNGNSREVQNQGNAQESVGSYDTPLTEKDKKNINYVIDTLSSKSMFSLLAVKSDLEAAGESTQHVNPLTHLQYIFSNPELKAKTKDIGNVPWNRYVGDFGDALQKAKDKGEINEEILKKFAKKVNVDYDILKPLYEKGDWKKFMNTLRDS